MLPECVRNAIGTLIHANRESDGINLVQDRHSRVFCITNTAKQLGDTVPNKTATLITRLGQCEKSHFELLAKRRNMSPSELLRNLVLAEVGKNDVFDTVEPVPQRVGTTRLTVRLAEFLMDSVRLRAESKGMASSRWVSALVQSHISNAPVATEKEVRMLRAIGRELSVIGRNVNQIARHLNATPTDRWQVDLVALSELPKQIEIAKLKIRLVIKATWQGWGVED